jgi:hypothetical protein
MIEANGPRRWMCKFCGYKEWMISDDWENRKARHEAQCPSDPNGAGHPLHGIIRMRPESVIANFRAEVNDKLSVVFHGADGTPLERSVHFRQCEEFLVEQFTSALNAAWMEAASVAERREAHEVAAILRAQAKRYE